MRQSVGLSTPLPMAGHLGQILKRFPIEPEGLTDLSYSRLVAIRDDVRRHRRSEFAVALVDVLDGLFALVARGQVQVDVGPFAAALAQEPFEEKLHADRIDGRDLEGIADGRVSGTPASLDQDIVPFAELDDVPNDKEV